MSWWGKVIGGAVGIAMGNPIIAILGAALGHLFDTRLKQLVDDLDEPGSQERVQTVFFTTVFSVMGHLAKIDGHVSRDEIHMATEIMRQMNLDAQQKKLAIELFNQGKQAGFPIHEVLQQFRQECGRRRNLKQMFVEILLHAAYADGKLHAKERDLLAQICTALGFSDYDFRLLQEQVQAQQAFHGSGSQQARQPRKDLLKEAYAVLAIKPSSSDAEVKKAYRRQMNQHHPDKLVAKGLPEEMLKLATEKTQEIKAAYETICRARGLK